jgi:putative redox protein
MSATTVTVRLLEEMAFRGTDSEGLSITMDADPAVGGQQRGPKPIAVLAMALGGCTGMDVIAILRKMRQDVTAYHLTVTGPRAESHPRTFTALEVEHVIQGNAVDPAAVRRAVVLSASRYCVVGALLSRAVPLVHRFRVLAADGTELGSGSIGATGETPDANSSNAGQPARSAGS